MVRPGKKLLLCIARSDDRVLSRRRIGADARSCYDRMTIRQTLRGAYYLSRRRSFT